MKKHLLMLSLFAAGAMLISCNKGHETEVPTVPEATISTGSFLTRTFAKPDGSKELTGSPNEKLKALLQATGPGIITSLGLMRITDEQYQEIKEFTDKLVTSQESETGKYNTIFKWVTGNIKYNNMQNNPQNKSYSNDPYDVFKDKICVCEGYANILTVMCFSQGIPTVVVNGFLKNVGGHAWAYTCPDNTWIVSDPTNNGTWPMKYTSRYGHLEPQVIKDVEIYRDDNIVCDYSNYNLNVREISKGDAMFTLPYSAMGYVINSFNPTVDLPDNIMEIYIGQNITTIGSTDDGTLGLAHRGRHLQGIYVDENNPTLMGHKGVVYLKNGNDPRLCYIPGGMPFIELLPMEVVEKGTISNHYSVEEIYLPQGTKQIEDFAIEGCPKLKRIYIPKDAEIAQDALYNCPADVEIVRGEPNSITHVTMD